MLVKCWSERQRPERRVGGRTRRAPCSPPVKYGPRLVKIWSSIGFRRNLIVRWSTATDQTPANYWSKLVKTDQILVKRRRRETGASAGRGRGLARRAPRRRLSRAYLTSVWPVFDHILTSVRPAFDQYLTSVVSARLPLVPPAADPQACERASDRARARIHTHTKRSRTPAHTHTRVIARAR